MARRVLPGKPARVDTLVMSKQHSERRQQSPAISALTNPVLRCGFRHSP